MSPITRAERVDTRKPQIMSAYDDKLQSFLEFVLGQYIQEGVGEGNVPIDVEIGCASLLAPSP